MGFFLRVSYYSNIGNGRLENTVTGSTAAVNYCGIRLYVRRFCRDR